MVYHKGETVICSITVKDSNGIPKDPDTSVLVTIKDPLENKVVENQEMNNSSLGNYYYDFQTSNCVGGRYFITYKIKDGTRTSIEKDEFLLG